MIHDFLKIPEDIMIERLAACPTKFEIRYLNSFLLEESSEMLMLLIL